MKKKNLKKIIAIFFVLVLNITSFAAIISDNDGTAFITKYEFDSLKYDFAKQVDDYNHSIDGKIDGAIAEYISGMSITPIETKKILYPCDRDETIYCMAKSKYADICKYQSGIPNFNYFGLIAQVDANLGYSNYNYSRNKLSSAASATSESRIILTSSDNFASDFVWDRYAEDVETNLSCFAYDTNFSPGAWGDNFRIIIFDGVPNLTGGSGYYSDFNTIKDFVYINVQHLYGSGTRWPGPCNNYIVGNKVASNDVSLSVGKTIFKSAIVWDTGTDRYVCTDDPHWVNTTCADQISQDAFSSGYLTFSNDFYVSQSGGKKTTPGGGATTRSQTLTNKLPVFGMYSSVIDMATVKNKKNVISYNNGTETLTDIRLINGVPLIYEKKGAYVEWTPIMNDSYDYNFYLSTTKFTGIPDPSTCIEVSVDGGTPTKTPVVKSGQKLSFTMPSDSVVWLKWSWSTGTGGRGELLIGSCAEYTRIDRS